MVACCAGVIDKIRRFQVSKTFSTRNLAFYSQILVRLYQPLVNKVINSTHIYTRHRKLLYTQLLLLSGSFVLILIVPRTFPAKIVLSSR